MKERLPNAVYQSLLKTIENGCSLNIDVADAVASAMKDWALGLGATHFTYCFSP